MEVAIKKFMMDILLWILEFLDTIFRLFGFLGGTEKVSTKSGAETTMISMFIEAGPVQRVFMSVFILAVIVCAVCIVVGIIKNTINLAGGERKPHGRTVGQGVFALVTTFVVASVMIAGISLANTALAEVNKSFAAAQDNSTIGSIIFDMSVEDGYVLEDTGEVDAEGNTIYVYKMDGDKISGWYAGDKPAGFDYRNHSGDTIFGRFSKSLGFEDADIPKTVGGKPTGLIRIDSFNFFVAYFAAIVMVVVIAISLLGLVKRLFDIVLLFITLPLMMATIPLDDGAKFKQWRETVISKVMLAYGAVFAINVFLLMMPIINNINFDDIGASIGSPLVANLFKLFLIIGGGLAANGGQLLFARLFGTSAEEAREMTQSARALIGGTAAAARGVGALKRAAVGGTNRYGRETKGILPTATNAAFTGLGAARHPKQATMDALRGTGNRMGMGNIFKYGAMGKKPLTEEQKQARFVGPSFAESKSEMDEFYRPGNVEAKNNLQTWVNQQAKDGVLITPPSKVGSWVDYDSKAPKQTTEDKIKNPSIPKKEGK